MKNKKNLKMMNAKKRNTKRLTTEEFIFRAKNVHGNKYDYSKVEYINNKTKVCIRCNKCGHEFWVKPNNHLNGQNCPYCVKNNFADLCRNTTIDDFRTKFYKKFGNKYEIPDDAVYLNSKTKIKVICHEKDENGIEHGEFWIRPNSLLNGHGCKKCYDSRRNSTTIYNTSKWIEKAKQIWGDRYDYSKVEYINSHTKVCIVCNKCGREFWQMPYDHLHKKGCKYCKESKLEKSVRDFFKNRNIEVLEQHTFDWLKTDNGTHQYLDFYIKEHKVGIECQGEQHFIPVDFGNKGREFAEKQFKEILKRDENKLKLCIKNNITIVYINYDDTEEIKYKKLIKVI